MRVRKKIKKRENSGSEEKVMAAALNEFASHGYAGARVDRIAAKAKVNKAMIYYHFRSKEKLYERIIKNIFEIFAQRIGESAVTDGEPIEALYAIIKNFMIMLDSFSINISQIMMREIASGGEVFKKAALPTVTTTILPLIKELIESAVKTKKIRDVNPYYTYLQVIGSAVFFNLVRIPLAGTDLGKIIFKEDYLNEYCDNFFKILRHGLELKDQRL